MKSMTLEEARRRWPEITELLETQIHCDILERRVAQLEAALAEQDRRLVAEVAAILEQQQGVL